jgi:signal transduction histidine kinase/DNA-binding response OmpR family regulator
MKISIIYKINIAFLITFVVISLFIVPMAIKIFENDYISHENEKMIGCLSQFRKGLDFLIDNLDVTVTDWATWDDLYHYAMNKNDSFIEDNLYPEALKKFGIHLVIILDKNGEVVYKTLFDTKKIQIIKVDDITISGLVNDIRLANAENPNGIKGITNFNQDVMLFSCRPIITSKGEGPPMGFFIMGRFFKDNVDNQLYKLTYLKTDLTDIESFLKTKKNVRIYDIINSKNAYIELFDNLINGYSILNDPFNRPAAVFKIAGPLSIYKRGIYAIKLFIVMFLVIIIASLIINLFYINNLFIKRLFTIFNIIKNISGSYETGSNFSVSGNDELSELAIEINLMLKKIKDSFDELEKSRVLLKIKAEDADSANRVKSRFLAIISHEIRTPLNSIIGFCDLMNDTPLDKEQKKMMNFIIISGKLLLNLLNNLLDFSKIEANKLTIENLEFNIIDIVVEVRNILLASAYNKKNKLNYNIDAKINFFIFGDMLRLRQVIMNLTSNALKFTEHGIIIINIEALSETSEEAVIKIAVEDNGIGIAPDKINNIFSPFEQADDMIFHKYGGTGLGLAISNELVKLMGGEKIFVNSVENKGSIFYFIIVFKKGGLLPVINRATVADDMFIKKLICDNIKILFADDDEFNRELGLRILGSAGCKVTVVCDGKEALQKIENEKYDIILLDVQMPVINGIQVARTLREKNLDVPIIAVTASVLKEIYDECKNAGINTVVSKPINANELITEVIRLIPPASPAIQTSDNSTEKVIEKIVREEQRGEKRTPLVFNYDKTLLNMGGQKLLLANMVNRFNSSWRDYLDDIETAYNTNELEKLKFCAHKFKGFALMAGAERLGDTLFNLEKTVKNNNKFAAGQLINDLKIELENYILAINELNLEK